MNRGEPGGRAEPVLRAVRLVVLAVAIAARALPGTAQEATNAAAAVPAVSPELQIDLANGYYSREYYKQAVGEFEKFLRLFPSHPRAAEAEYRLGECFRELQKKEDSERRFQLVAQKYPDTDFGRRSIYRLGETRFHEKKYDEALRMLTPLLEQAVSPAVRNGASYYAARALAEQKKWAEVEKLLLPVSRAPDLAELGPFIQELLGRAYRAQSRNTEALAVWEEALKLKPTEGLALDLLLEISSLKLETGDAKGALEGFGKLRLRSLPEGYRSAVAVGWIRAAGQAGAFKEIADVGPALYDSVPEAYRPEAAYLIGSGLRKTGQWKRAMEWLEKCASARPASPYAESALYELITCAVGADDDETLAKAGGRFTGEFPDSPQAAGVHFLLGELAFKQQKFRDALPHYDFVSAKTSDAKAKSDTAYKKAWCLFELGEKDRARKSFEEFGAAWPEDENAADALYLAAGLAAELGRWQDAAAGYSKLLQRWPDRPRNDLALFELAVAQGRLKDYAAMDKSLKAFIEKYPKHARSAEAWYWLGWLATQKKNWPEALECFDRAAADRKSPFRDEVRLRRIVVYFYLKRPEPAHPEIADFASRNRLKEIPVEVIRWNARSQLDRFHSREAVDAFRWYLETAQGKSQITEAQMGLARAHAGQGNWAGALQSYRKVIASEGVDEPGLEARLGAARAIVELGENFASAQTLIEEVMTERPEGVFNARARLLEGDILSAQKKYPEAAGKYYSVGILFDDPELTPWGLKLAADSFEKAGNLAEARRVREELAKRYPKESDRKPAPGTPGSPPKP